ncbi:hypothetical protein HMPREF1868_00464 [Olsenella sp. DNF00959]|nr:hypothetical protein HMPREF1868_00464 [Olsenella sp. DNF00959]
MRYRIDINIARHKTIRASCREEAHEHCGYLRRRSRKTHALKGPTKAVFGYPWQAYHRAYRRAVRKAFGY